MLENKAPTEDAKREWYYMERRRLSLDANRDRQATNRTSTHQRPTAYIPVDPVHPWNVQPSTLDSMSKLIALECLQEFEGIPKPYGANGLFKPSQPGATMRHIRVPQPKAIEI